MERRPRILIVGPNQRLGGGMPAVIRWLDGSPLRKTYELIRVDTYPGAGPWKNITVFVKAFRTFVAMLVWSNVDLVHLHSASRGSFYRKSAMLLTARLFGKPVVFHLHGGAFARFHADRSWIGRAYIRVVLNLASEVVVLTDGWRREVSAMKGNGRSITVLMNPVRIPDQPPTRNGNHGPGVRVLFLGAIEGRKGVFDLLESARRLASELPDLRFTLCGDGQVEQAREIIQRHGLEASVDMPGWVDHPELYLKKADIFVLPSYIEGLPMSILEAQSRGLPVIATRVGGIPEVVKERETGFLIQPGDVDALTDRIRTLSRDAGLRNAMGARGYALVRDQCREELIAERLDGMYRRLLG